MEGGKFTLPQLKETLRRFGLQQKGNKPDLLKRLYDHDPSGAWKLIASEIASQTAHVEEEGAAQTSGAAELTEGDITMTQVGDEPRDGSISSDRNETVRLRDKELEITRRERDLLQRELELLRLETRMEAETRNAALPMFANQYTTTRPQVKALSELLSEFSGDENTFWKWHRQFELIRTTYQLDDGTARILVSMRLKNKALQWFHSTPEHLELPVNQLLEKMQNIFDHRPAKIDLRKKFERRTWRFDETFSNYFYDKIILANKVPVDEEELTDYIIDGIPDGIMRTQARIQRFEKKEDLLKSFEKIALRPNKQNFTGRGDNKAALDKTAKHTQDNKIREDDEDRKEVKCYNCNLTGHLAKNCTRPKRERGSCFKCGAMDHKLRECPQQKSTTSSTRDVVKTEAASQISNVEEQKKNINEFLKPSAIQISGYGLSLDLKVDSQLDTASPISLIKSRLVPVIFIHGGPDDCYEGINGSKLEILGQVTAKISLEERHADNIKLRVVPDNAMKGDIILGRDAITSLNFDLFKEKTIDVTKEIMASEILNIESSVFEGDELDTLKVNPCLSNKIHEKFIQNFQTNYLEAERPLEPKIKAEMKLHVKDNQPFHFAPARLSQVEKVQLRQIIDDLLTREIIRPGSSEYASRTVLVRKKDGRMRLCIDYRELNKITAKDNYPLPIIEDQIDSLRGKRYFSLLDLKDGFHHVHMSEDSIKYTAFVTPFGQYEYVKMPFGLRNAPAQFQRHVNEVLSELIKRGDLVAYIDDFMIATETIEKHLEVLNEVYHLLVQNLLELRLDKCQFLSDEIEFLGYIVSEKGIRPSDHGIVAVKNFPIPRNIRDIQSFVGLCSYFRKFIKGFSQIAGPLYDLLKKNTTFEFGKKQSDAFELLKNKLSEAPILVIYNPTDPTELHCDASSQGFGAVLLQRKSDNQFHPVFYFSKRATEVESRYHSYELETLAIIYALRRFRVYLLGISFKIVTDCNALIMTLNKKVINPRIARWALELQDFDYCTEHRPGKIMSHVDALSRINSILVVEANTFEFNLTICQS